VTATLSEPASVERPACFTSQLSRGAIGKGKRGYTRSRSRGFTYLTHTDTAYHYIIGLYS
jgi:hypothetical protein